MSAELPPAGGRHIRLTSHPQQGPSGAPPIHWGAEDPMQRGPVVGTTTHRSHRNVIGTHSGSYGVYRALAVAAGNLTRGHRADLTNTSPTTSEWWMIGAPMHDPFLSLLSSPCVSGIPPSLPIDATNPRPALKTWVIWG